MNIDILKKIRKDESGATAIEYGLIAALVSFVAIGALTAMGGSQNTISQTVSAALTDVVDSGPDNNNAGGLGGGKAAGGKGKGGKAAGGKGKGGGKAGGDLGKSGKGKGGGKAGGDLGKSGKGKGGGKAGGDLGKSGRGKGCFYGTSNPSKPC